MSDHSSRGYPNDHLPLAKRLRREMTPAEAILWRHVRAKRFGGFKFRRQQPVGPFIADFLCASAKVIVELDGDTHVGREAHDAARQAALEGMGFGCCGSGTATCTTTWKWCWTPSGWRATPASG